MRHKFQRQRLTGAHEVHSCSFRILNLFQGKLFFSYISIRHSSRLNCYQTLMEYFICCKFVTAINESGCLDSHALMGLETKPVHHKSCQLICNADHQTDENLL